MARIPAQAGVSDEPARVEQGCVTSMTAPLITMQEPDSQESGPRLDEVTLTNLYSVVPPRHWGFYRSEGRDGELTLRFGVMFVPVHPLCVPCLLLPSCSRMPGSALVEPAHCEETVIPPRRAFDRSQLGCRKCAGKCAA